MNNKKDKFRTIRVLKTDAEILKSMSRQLSPPDRKMDFAELVNEAVRLLQGHLTGKQKIMPVQEYELIENGKIAELEKQLVERWEMTEKMLKAEYQQRQLELDLQELDLRDEREQMLQSEKAVAAVCAVLAKTCALNELISLRNLDWKQADYHKAAESIMREQPAQLERLGQNYAKKAIETVNREGIPEPQETGLLDRVFSKLGIAKSKGRSNSEQMAASNG